MAAAWSGDLHSAQLLLDTTPVQIDAQDFEVRASPLLSTKGSVGDRSAKLQH